jgi:hypothetical protein
MSDLVEQAMAGMGYSPITGTHVQAWSHPSGVTIVRYSDWEWIGAYPGYTRPAITGRDPVAVARQLLETRDD